MTQLAGPLAVVVLGLGVVSASVQLGRDATILVSPPDAVVEEFVRQLVAKREDLAVVLLQNPAPSRVAELEAMGASLRQLGGIARIDASLGSLGDVEAQATAVVSGVSGAIALTCALEREHSIWKIRDCGAEPYRPQRSAP